MRMLLPLQFPAVSHHQDDASSVGDLDKISRQHEIKANTLKISERQIQARSENSHTLPSLCIPVGGTILNPGIVSNFA